MAQLLVHFAGGQGPGQGCGLTDVLAGGGILIGQGEQQEAVVEGPRILGEGCHHGIAAPQGFRQMVHVNRAQTIRPVDAALGEGFFGAGRQQGSDDKDHQGGEALGLAALRCPVGTVVQRG
jgi:hypothetical protein